MRCSLVPPAHDLTTGKPVLDYTHFSISFSAGRKLAIYTAVNIDGARWRNLPRHADKWVYDPRLPREIQVGNDFYGNEPGGNYFDRGHLVRRLDPVWGDLEAARLANDDTFHWTNCSPQYFLFNQSAQLWNGLENYILSNTDTDNLRATAFSGPVFREDDYLHRGVFVPQYFWKVVAVTDDQNKLYTSAYVVSQKKWALDIPFEELPVGNFRNFQIPMAKIESLTGLVFSEIYKAADMGASIQEDLPLRSLADVQHPRR